MAIKAVQQLQIGAELTSEKKAGEVLKVMAEAGYDGIELNGFMIKKMPVIVTVLMALAGMSIGKSGRLDWKKLISESGLKVVGIHEDLGSILNHPQEMIEEAGTFGTEFIVVTGMHRFDYSNRQAVMELTEKLNRAGKLLKAGGIRFLYHNHNCEFRKVETGETAFQLILEHTDPQYVNFEFDSYWPAEAGVCPLEMMDKLGTRMKLYHINDRGSRVTGPKSSILKSDCMELGYGNMNLAAMVERAKQYGVTAVILETHRNWADKSPVKSFQLSAEFMNQYV